MWNLQHVQHGHSARATYAQFMYRQVLFFLALYLGMFAPMIHAAPTHCCQIDQHATYALSSISFQSELPIGQIDNEPQALSARTAQPQPTAPHVTLISTLFLIAVPPDLVVQDRSDLLLLRPSVLTLPLQLGQPPPDQPPRSL